LERASKSHEKSGRSIQACRGRGASGIAARVFTQHRILDLSQLVSVLVSAIAPDGDGAEKGVAITLHSLSFAARLLPWISAA